MNGYRVSFYKDLLNSDGHNFRCLQRQIDVDSNDPSQALVLAEGQIDHRCLNIDCIEVVHLVDDSQALEHPSSSPPQATFVAS
jgi:hypothetical protein